jgi:hypothetical protein
MGYQYVWIIRPWLLSWFLWAWLGYAKEQSSRASFDWIFNRWANLENILRINIFIVFNEKWRIIRLWYERCRLTRRGFIHWAISFRKCKNRINLIFRCNSTHISFESLRDKNSNSCVRWSPCPSNWRRWYRFQKHVVGLGPVQKRIARSRRTKY